MFRVVGKKLAILTVGAAGCLLAVLLLTQGGSVSQGVLAGLRLCGNAIIPSLFVFMILAVFLCRSPAVSVLSFLLAPITRWVFRLPRELGGVVAMSFIGGYPVGAKLIGDMVRRGEISECHAGRLMCFCSNAGPAFVVTAVGMSLLGNVRAGVILLIAHLSTSFLIATVSGWTHRHDPVAVKKPGASCSFGEALVGAVSTSTTAVLSICAYVLLFSALLSLLRATGILPALTGALATVTGQPPELFDALLGGFLEVTTGCASLASLRGIANPLVLMAFFLSFSSLSIILQVRHNFQGTRVPLRGYMVSRLVSGCLAAAITYLLLRLFPSAAEAGMYFYPPVPVMSTRSYFALACLVVVCSAFLISISAGVSAVSDWRDRRKKKKDA